MAVSWGISKAGLWVASKAAPRDASWAERWVVAWAAWLVDATVVLWVVP